MASSGIFRDEVEEEDSSFRTMVARRCLSGRVRQYHRVEDTAPCSSAFVVEQVHFRATLSPRFCIAPALAFVRADCGVRLLRLRDVRIFSMTTSLVASAERTETDLLSCAVPL